MMAIIASLIPWEWVAAASVVAAGLLATWFGGKRSAKTSVKIDALKDEVKAHEIRYEVENRIADDRAARQRLRDDWQR